MGEMDVFDPADWAPDPMGQGRDCRGWPPRGGHGPVGNPPQGRFRPVWGDHGPGDDW